MVHLVDDGGFYSKHIHIIGFSLGAHVAGCSGYKFRRLSSYDVKVGKITGLDPSGPSFEDIDSRDRLSSDDAHFVECIHSCISLLGYTNPVGDIDYYSDGGICNQQAMCKNEDYLNNCKYIIFIFYQYFIIPLIMFIFILLFSRYLWTL